MLAWYAANARDLPWRRPECSAWGVFVSEVMAQQTPLSRVEPAWHEWMARWPTPAALAADEPGDAVRAWGRLGYPRRAVRLHAAAVAMVERHDGQVPTSQEDLLALPGVGAYTAAAVGAFAFGTRTTVVDTNVRRVLARALTGDALPAPTLTVAESSLATAALPEDDERAAVWNVASMELGALVCTARSPRCDECPIADLCAWRLAGSPEYAGPARVAQRWHGTDRQIRGRLLAVAREATGPVPLADLRSACPEDEPRLMRLLDALVTEGLLTALPGDRYRL